MFNGQLEKIIKKRRSIRRYRPDLPPEEWIEKILSATTWAPSPSNIRPVRYVRIESKVIKERLKNEMAQGKERLLRKLDILNNSKKLRKWIEVYYNRYSIFMFDAPVLFVVGIQKKEEGLYEKLKDAKPAINYNRDWALDISVGISICHFILMAETMGLGTCILTTPLIFIDDINRLLCVDNINFRCFLTLGFPDESPSPPERISISDLCIQI